MAKYIVFGTLEIFQSGVIAQLLSVGVLNYTILFQVVLWHPPKLHHLNLILKPRTTSCLQYVLYVKLFVGNIFSEQLHNGFSILDYETIFYEFFFFWCSVWI